MLDHRAIRRALRHTLILGVVAALMSPTAALAKSEDPRTRTLRDPRAVGRTVHVNGHVRAAVVEGKHGLETIYAVQTKTGRFVGLHLAKGQYITPNSTFSGDIAADTSVAGRVASATITAPATASSVSARTHTTYIAMPNAIGTFPDDSVITSYVANSANHWAQDIANVVSSVSQHPTIAKYDSTAVTSSNCSSSMVDPWPVWSEAASQFAGVDFLSGAANHLIVLLPESCASGSQTGVGTIGNPGDGGEIIAYGASKYLDTLTHEIGHNLGLGHANVLNPVTNTESPYCDVYSVMGYETFVPNQTALGSAHRDALGFALGGELQQFPGTTTGATTVTLNGRGETAGVRGLRLVEPGSGKVYYVDFRSGSGLDAGDLYTTTNSGICYKTFATGLVMTTAGQAQGETDLIPGPGSQAYAGVGQSLTTPSGQISVTLNSAAGSSAQVNVTYTQLAAFSTAPKPTISGTASKGLTVSAVSSGWSPTPDTQTYQWLINGAPTYDEAGMLATGSSYTIQPFDVGAQLSLQVTSTKAGYLPTTVTSDPVTVTGPAVISPVPTAKITGLPNSGQTLTASIGTYPTDAFTSTEWQLNDAGTWTTVGYGPTYLLTDAEIGKTLRIKVSASMSGFLDTVATSTAFGPIQVALKQLTVGAPTIGGTLKVGRYLTARPGTWTSYTTLSYRWYANGVAITNATKKRLYLRKGQRGKMITVVVTGKKSGYATASVTSPARGPVL